MSASYTTSTQPEIAPEEKINGFRRDLTGKVAIVTGGGKNLGALIAYQLAQLGAKIVIHYNSESSRKESEETAEKIRLLANGTPEPLLVQADLTKVSQVESLFVQAKEHFGCVDIAINTAGLLVKKPIIQLTEEDIDRSLSVNTKLAFFFIQQAGIHLNDNGRICTILTSLLAAFAPYYAAYAGTKAPVEHFTRAAAKEFGSRGISVSSVAPGPMDTPFFYAQNTPESIAFNKTSAALSGYTKTGLTHVEDISPLVVSLVTDGWWVSGTTIFANGGNSTR